MDTSRDPGHVSRAPGLPGRGEHHGVDTEHLNCEIHLFTCCAISADFMMCLTSS